MTQQIARRAAALCLMAGVTIFPPVLKAGGTFSQAVAISTGTGNTQGSAAIDAAGNSLVLWENGSGQISSASHPLQGPWSAPSLLSGTFPLFLQVKTTTSGSATAVWEDGSGTGIWSSDRSSNGKWSSPTLVVSGVYNTVAPIKFVIDSQGDAAILWPSQGIARNKSAPPTQIYAIRRSAGQAWGPQQTLAQNTWAAFDDAVLADNGDLIVAWHTYGLVCGKYSCSETNIVLHASREMKGSLTWQDSGSLGAALAYGIKVAADMLGRAAVVYQMAAGSVTETVSIVEQGAGLPWSAPAVISSGTAVMIDTASDAAGDLTLALSIGSGVVVSVGHIASNTWSALTTVSGTDYVYGTAFGFAVSSSGAAVLSWTVATPPNVQALEVRAISRPSALAAWTAPQTISAGFLPNGASIDTAAVNASGNGVVVFEAVDATGAVRSIYASTF
jgi:hypothetical protein